MFYVYLDYNNCLFKIAIKCRCFQKCTFLHFFIFFLCKKWKKNAILVRVSRIKFKTGDKIYIFSRPANNIEILQKLTILESFIELETSWMSAIGGVSIISPVFDFRSRQQIHIWNLHDLLVLTVPITLKYSKNWPF